MSISTVQINDKSAEVRISNQAHAALANAQYTDGLKVDFHPVMTRHCADTELGEDGPPMTDFPIVKPQAFTPRWLSIDFKKGQWQGEFGY